MKDVRSAAICVHPFIKVDFEAKKVPVKVPGRVLILDENGDNERFIEMPFAGHRVYQNPANPRRAIVLIKWGLRGCEVDLEDLRPLKYFEPLPGHTFFGHLTFAPDGETYYCSETRNDAVGFISERRFGDHSVVRVLSSYGQSPHEVKYEIARDRLWIANGGSFKPYPPVPYGAPAGYLTGPCVSVVDRATGRLVHQTEFDTPAGPTHMEFLDDGGVMVVGGTRGKDVLFAVLESDGRIRAAPEGALPQGPLLSIAIDGAEAYATNPVDGHVHVWNLRTGEHRRSWDAGMPTGILRWRNGDLWLIDNRARSLNCRRGEAIDRVPVSLRPDEVFGSHFTELVSWNRP